MHHIPLHIRQAAIAVRHTHAFNLSLYSGKAKRIRPNLTDITTTIRLRVKPSYAILAVAHAQLRQLRACQKRRAALLNGRDAQSLKSTLRRLHTLRAKYRN